MIKQFKGDVIDLVKKSNILSDRLAFFKASHPDFNYEIKLTIGKTNSTLLVKNAKTS